MFKYSTTFSVLKLASVFVNVPSGMDQASLTWNQVWMRRLQTEFSWKC